MRIFFIQFRGGKKIECFVTYLSEFLQTLHYSPSNWNRCSSLIISFVRDVSTFLIGGFYSYIRPQVLIPCAGGQLASFHRKYDWWCLFWMFFKIMWHQTTVKELLDVYGHNHLPKSALLKRSSINYVNIFFSVFDPLPPKIT